jgi:MGT family glycosyltransferase
MARVLIYTSPARGHLFPILGVATELDARGHDLTVVTLRDEVERVRRLGLAAEPLVDEVEARELDDYKGRNPLEALRLSVATFADRAPHDHADLAAAISRHRPDAIVVDNNSWGALTAAEASGVPWCSFQPYFTPLPSPDVPPFGPGLLPARGLLGRMRDAAVRPMLNSMVARLALPPINQLRAADGLQPVKTMAEFLTRPDRTLYFTAEPFEYPRRDWPASYEMVGAATWSPTADAPDWLDDIDRPIVLVTCSTERQEDAAILETALAALADEDVFVVGTGAAHDPARFTAGDNARIERFLPHDPVVQRAAAVVCHGGMGITQRALSHGVPVCVVPYGRDQLEVARRVEHAGAGVRLLPKRLNPERLRGAVRKTQDCTDGAARVAAAFRNAGGPERAAKIVERLVSAPLDPSRNRI